MDLFGSTTTGRTARFYSRSLCPNSLGAKALAHCWDGENAWENPPFHLMGAVV